MLLFLILPYFVYCQRPIINISDGTIIGIFTETWMGRKVNTFQSIPFAAPPIGSLRFQAPQPVSPWTTPLDAGATAPACPQFALVPPNSYDEDCLYLNVYTPQLPSPSNQVLLPVIVYIHPGSFTFLSGSAFGPRYLLDYDIILVTINYRLGALGFLSSGDIAIPGNMGLKDQVAALQWVKKNIASFGGNPDEITLAGTSAGAASVSFHFISNMSRGLFKRGICMSGSSLIPSALQKASSYKFNFLASSLNCSDETNTSNVISCLKQAPVESILSVQAQLTSSFYNTPPLAYGPVMEVDHEGAFLSESPFKLLSTGHIYPGAVLFSIDTQEGLFPTASFILNSTGVEALNNSFNQYAPYLLDYNYLLPGSALNQTSEIIRYYYFGNATISSELNQTIIQMSGDRTIIDGVQKAARLQAHFQEAPIYFYQFGYQGPHSILLEAFTGSNVNLGVGHADDIMYILNTTLTPPPENRPSDRAMIRTMSSLWANFATTGYPSLGNTTWMPINSDSVYNGPIDFMQINSPTSIVSNSTLDFGHAVFWNSLPINGPFT